MPSYYADYFDAGLFRPLLDEVNWVKETNSRQECFMAPDVIDYTYGAGSGARTYTSGPYHPIVLAIQDRLNFTGSPVGGAYNVCFLNLYIDQKNSLGWHADDSPGMRHDHPIAVASFGQPREIWWRTVGQKGVIPAEQRQMLGSGSLFIMPPGFQLTHEHRIPKGDRDMSPRISLTFRQYIPVD